MFAEQNFRFDQFFVRFWFLFDFLSIFHPFLIDFQEINSKLIEKLIRKSRLPNFVHKQFIYNTYTSITTSMRLLR